MPQKPAINSDDVFVYNVYYPCNCHAERDKSSTQKDILTSLTSSVFIVDCPNSTDCLHTSTKDTAGHSASVCVDWVS